MSIFLYHCEPFLTFGYWENIGYFCFNFHFLNYVEYISHFTWLFLHLLPFMWFTHFSSGIFTRFLFICNGSLHIWDNILDIFFFTFSFISFIFHLFACPFFCIIEGFINFYVLRFIGYYLNFFVCVRKDFFTLRF